jgi:hypothetical protein
MPVMGAGGERAAHRQLDDSTVVLAAKDQHIDHLAGGLQGAALPRDRLPRRIEALRQRPRSRSSTHHAARPSLSSSAEPTSGTGTG